MKIYRSGDEVVFETIANIIGTEGSKVLISFNGFECLVDANRLTLIKRSIHKNDVVMHGTKVGRVVEVLEKGVFLVNFPDMSGAEAYRVSAENDLDLYEEEGTLVLQEEDRIQEESSNTSVAAEFEAPKLQEMPEPVYGMRSEPVLEPREEQAEIHAEAPAPVIAPAPVAVPQAEVSVTPVAEAPQAPVANEATPAPAPAPVAIPAPAVGEDNLKEKVENMVASLLDVTGRAPAKKQVIDLEALGETQIVPNVASANMVLGEDLVLKGNSED